MTRPRAPEPKWLLVIVFFIAGIFMGGLGSYLGLSTTAPFLQRIHSQSSRYRYINPLLGVDIPNSKQFLKDATLELEMQGLINQAERNQHISDAAIYFRDIEAGYWVGINEASVFSPGKLLKIPIMITYFKLAESHPGILEKEIAFTERTPHNEELFFPSDRLVIGQTYTVNDLIERMIVFGDDDAADLLFDNVDKSSLNEVFSDLGIQFREDKETNDVIPLKFYSLFFRVLYNATYLNRDLSEKALRLLVLADNSVGIAAALPNDLGTANRYGGRSYVNHGVKYFEMYDCGIIYHPGHPYLLCSVVRGPNIAYLKTFLKELGARVYTEMSYKYR